METLQPKLRFPEFQGDWCNYTLEQLTIKIGDGLHGTPQYVENSDVYFINGNNLIDGKIVINENSKKVSVETLNKNNKGLNENSILISINGTIGSISRYNNEKIMLGKSVGYFNFKKSKDFYFYILQSKKIQDYFISELTGSTIKNLSLKTLRETNIYQPSLEEQTKIANFLSSVDEKLNLLKEKKTLLEDYKKGIMQKIFNQEIRFKDDNGNDFEDWEVKCLGDILIKNSRKNKNLIVTYVESISNKFGFVSQEDYFDSNNIASKNLSNYYVIENGFFAYNPSRINVGSLAYKNDHKTSVISPLYISFKTKNDINDIFLLNYFDTLNFINQMNASFEGSVRNTLSYESLVKIKISLPCIEEQTKIANFLSAIDEKIELVSNQIQDTQEYKKGLLQQMFV